MTAIAAHGGGDGEKVRQFEAEWGLHLPVDYRSFLLEFNGGQPSPNWCHVSGLRQSVTVDALFGLGVKPGLDLATWMREYREEIGADNVIIGGDAGANLFLLGKVREVEGVFYWDHSHTFAGSSEEEGNTYFLARTFSRFLEALQPPHSV
jgi:hypothetical protein